MSITTMCNKTEPGAVRSEEWSKGGNEIYLKTTHVGLVLSMGEVNGYDDSDFYAIVWNDEKGEPERIVYASTRGWSYPNTASVDATPEVRAKADALAAKTRAEQVERARVREAATPNKGKQVRVVKASRGKGAAPVGTEGIVFYFAVDAYDRSDRYTTHLQRSIIKNLGLRDPRKGMRVGFKTADGKSFFMNAMNVEVI